MSNDDPVKNTSGGWKRDNIETDVSYPHRMCAMPFDQTDIVCSKIRSGFVSLFPDSQSANGAETSDQTSAITEETNTNPEPQQEVAFLTGRARWMLKNTPIVVFFATIVFFWPTDEISPWFGVGSALPVIPGFQRVVQEIVSYIGIKWLFPTLPTFGQITAEGIIRIGLIVPLGVLLLILVVRSDIFDAKGCDAAPPLLNGLLFYGLLVVLGVGTGLDMVDAVSTQGAAPTAFYNGSGYLLLLFLGGVLVYDGMLRTESLFGSLEDLDVIEPTDGESNFVESLNGALTRRVGALPWLGSVRIISTLPLAAVFAFFFNILVIPRDEFLISIIVFSLDVVMLMVAFNFLILIRYFHNLVADFSSKNRGVESKFPNLTYEPFHPDERGGYRDFGKFATRVNILLILGGLYQYYQLVITVDQSPRAIVVPIAAYLIGVGTWFYFSFWMLHMRMMHERRALLDYFQNPNVESKEELLDTMGLEFQGPIGSSSEEDIKAAELIDLRLAMKEAPVWPISNRQITSLITANFGPLLLLLLQGIF